MHEVFMPDIPDDPTRQGTGFTRRGFIATIGAGAAAAATVAGSTPVEAAQGAGSNPAEMVRVSLTINGRSHRLLVEPRWSLLFVLRDRLGLTATKPGCERGECGVCTVLVDDKPAYLHDARGRSRGEDDRRARG
jgi:xanthine dehydrogenase YagT iron-sulfur-binding subunit